MNCLQELCAHWSGDGNVCPCALLELDPATDPESGEGDVYDWQKDGL